jgi:hypothetical protein
VLEADLYVPGRIRQDDDDLDSVPGSPTTAEDTTLLDHGGSDDLHVNGHNNGGYLGMNLVDVSLGSLVVPGSSALSVGTGSMFISPTPTTTGSTDSAWQRRSPPSLYHPPAALSAHKSSPSLAMTSMTTIAGTHGGAGRMLGTNGVAPAAPLNPRDHSLLEYIYDEMHAARFLNTSPASLLASYVSLYFKGVFIIVPQTVAGHSSDALRHANPCPCDDFLPS